MLRGEGAEDIESPGMHQNWSLQSRRGCHTPFLLVLTDPASGIISDESLYSC
jgi:hypothetical protein